MSVGSERYPATSPPSAALPSFPVVGIAGDAAAMETAEYVEQAVALSCDRRLVTGSGSYLGEFHDWLAGVEAMTRKRVDNLTGTSLVKVLGKVGGGRKTWRCGQGPRNYSTHEEAEIHGAAQSLHFRHRAWGIGHDRRILCTPNKWYGTAAPDKKCGAAARC